MVTEMMLFEPWRQHSALGYRRLQAWLGYLTAKPLASFGRGAVHPASPARRRDPASAAAAATSPTHVAGSGTATVPCTEKLPWLLS